ncbi:acetyltransferase [Pusillimonas sp. SM2304]|uniref:acetyltransferase n=1 Tax=Pusillimonas sp. SM2304 TaxID=3073241 RepID=UPI0028750817|nr:acetyltransferase [Pusillimonas sp. SM2304]MDS1140055.1 acetyltransferase [Pusillimonas sp. SM2304]
MKRLAIVGAGGHGRVIADAAQSSGWTTIDFYDDAWPDTGASTGPWPLIGDTLLLLARLHDYQGVIVGIGNNHTRAALQQRLLDAGAPLASVIHPAAVISRHTQLGAGCAVFARAVVNVGARIGAGVILNTGCIIEHDCVVEDFAHIGPNAGLGGGVYIGRQSWVGIGANINHLIHIGRDSTIGSGTTVIRDVPDAMVAVGTPARARPA